MPNQNQTPQDPWAVVSQTPSATPQAQPTQTQDPWAVVSQTPNSSSPAQSQPGIGSRILEGVTQSVKQNVVEPAKAIGSLVKDSASEEGPADAKEHLVNTLVGLPGLAAYRAGKAVVDAAESSFKAHKENFENASQDLVRAVNEFHNKDYRNALSSTGSFVTDTMGMTGDPTAGRMRELTEGTRPGGDLVTPLAKNATDVALMYLGEKAPNVAGRAGQALETGGLKRIGGLLRATNPDSYLFGHDPRAAIIEENIPATRNFQDIYNHLDKAADNLHSQLTNILATSPTKDIDLVPVINKATDDLLQEIASARGLKNREGIVSAVKDYRDELIAQHDVDGNVIARPTKTHLSPADVVEVKKDIGKSATWDYTNDPNVEGYVNKLQKTLYRQLDGIVDQAGPEVADLNRRLGNTIEARRLIAKRIPREDFTDVGLARLGRKVEWAAAAKAAAAHEPVTAAVLAGNRVARSVPGRIAIGKAEAGAGKTLQSPSAQQAAKVAGKAGQAAILFRDSTGAHHQVNEDQWDKVLEIDPGAVKLVPETQTN
jgi:hypothetical protein